MIEQLNLMESSLDQLLSFAEKKGVGPNDTDHVYNVANDIAKTVDSVKKDLNEIDNRITQTTRQNEEKLKTITYESNRSRDKIYLDVKYFLIKKNDLTVILNDYYESMKTLQLMQHKLNNNLSNIETELAERKSAFKPNYS
jgi:septal ring factor EnvC (AmiA/AmiB activator)